VWAQTVSSSSDDLPAAFSSSSLLPDAPIPSSLANDVAAAVPSPAAYTPPNAQQRFDNYRWNALGPVAFAGSSVAAAIDQAFNFPHAWGQGMDAYGARVASNLGISLVTATAQYSIAEAFHQDTTYYRCACKGFFPRFWHAAVSSVTARSLEDGHREFSLAMTASPFIGPLTAANSWIPTHDGAHLGFNMGVHNLMGQFGQDEALEFFYGGPHTLLSSIRHRFLNHSSATN
jgi:hypothetical protein